MAGEYTGGGAAAGGLSVGTLTINLALNTGDFARQLDAVNRNTKSMADKLKAEFDKAGGSIGNIGERIGQVSKGIEKMFGDKAPAALQAFGKEVQRVMGMSDAQVKGLKQTAESLEGAFKVAGQAVTALLSPLGAVLAAALGVAAAVGAIKNAAGNGKQMAGVFGGGAEYKANKQWVLDNVPGAAWAGDMLGRGVDRAKADWNRAANTPGSFVETVSKADPVGDIKAGLGRTFDDLAEALKPVMDKLKGLLEPGKTDSEKKASAKAFAAAEKERLEEQRKAWAEADEAISIQLMALADQEIKDARELAEQEKAARAAAADAVKETLREMAEAERQVQEAARQAEQQRVARWQALGSGQIGTATGVGGIVGAGMNIVGGAASQYQLTGTAMQGAAQGGQAAGPWGAVIGAIIALATQTESFRKLMGGIEEALGSILPLLGELIEPIVASITGALDVLSPVLKIITKITDAFSSALKPIYSFADSLGDLLGAIGDWVDSINTSGLTSWTDKSLGNENDQWGKYSLMDWMTLTPLISEAANEIDKALTKAGQIDEFSAADGPSAEAQALEAKQKAERREAWDFDPRNPYYMQNLNARALAAAEERQREAKERETREAERAAAALRELSDSVANSVAGYKLLAVQFAASGSINRDPTSGNPFS